MEFLDLWQKVIQRKHFHLLLEQMDIFLSCSLWKVRERYAKLTFHINRNLRVQIYGKNFIVCVTLSSKMFCKQFNQLMCFTYYAQTNLKLQHPLPPSLGKAREFELLKIGLFKFPLPRAKMVFKCLPYHRICLSYPTKEQSLSAPDLFCKQIAHKCYISSFKLFHLIQTRVLWMLVTSAPGKKIIWNLTLPVLFFPPPHAGKGQRGGGGGDVELLIWWVHYHHPIHLH